MSESTGAIRPNHAPLGSREARAKLTRRAAEVVAAQRYPGSKDRNKRGALGKRSDVDATVEKGMEVLRSGNPLLTGLVLSELTEMIRADDRNAWTALQAAGLAQMEIVRRMCFEDVQSRGVTVESAIGVDSGGNAIYALKENPALTHMAKLSDLMGITARDMLLSKKSAIGAAKDGEIAQYLRDRNERMRKANKSGLPPPRRLREVGPIECEALPADEKLEP